MQNLLSRFSYDPPFVLASTCHYIVSSRPTPANCLPRGPDETPFEFGVFRAILKFPHDYPQSPPTMRFTSSLFHPNGEATNGSVHFFLPGRAEYEYESQHGLAL
jgi:ubiquitin-protein ligase